MPSKTFFNLKPHKKQMIIDSAIDEFNLFTLKGAKVVRIIKRVNISRASFYKYFECIDELYYYILEKVAEKVIDDFKRIIIDNNGEFFLSVHDLFIDYITRPGKYTDSISRIFSIDFSESYLYANRYMANLNKSVAEVFELIDVNKVRLNNPEDILDLFNIVISMIDRIITLIKVGHYTERDAIVVYKRRINVIEFGLGIHNSN